MQTLGYRCKFVCAPYQTYHVYAVQLCVGAQCWQDIESGCWLDAVQGTCKVYEKANLQLLQYTYFKA